MIISKDINLKLELPVTNEQIETKFEELGLDVLRWAVVKADGNSFIIRISCIKK